MKRVLLSTGLGLLLAVAPGAASACGEYDATSASATPPAQMGLAPAPAASKADPVVVTKAPAAKSPKQSTAKKGQPVDNKVAAASN